MKKVISILVIALTFTLNGNAQETMKKDAMMKDDNIKVVSLEQTKGAFTQESITLAEGSYVFEISNYEYILCLFKINVIEGHLWHCIRFPILNFFSKFVRSAAQKYFR